MAPDPVLVAAPAAPARPAPLVAGTAIGILAALSFCHLLNDMMQSLLPAIYPILKRGFNLDFGQIGLITLTNQLTASLLQVAVKRRVLLHRHLGFATHVAVNDRVAGLLSRIPGLQLVQGPAHPGHMCSALAAVPGALAKAAGETWAAAAAGNYDTVCTIFHSCHRELSALDGNDNVSVRNWVHLVAEAMGLEASDAYLGWRNGGAPDIAAIERADESRYHSLVETELRKPPPL